jgi:hypothetical protein
LKLEADEQTPLLLRNPEKQSEHLTSKATFKLQFKQFEGQFTHLEVSIE